MSKDKEKFDYISAQPFILLLPRLGIFLVMVKDACYVWGMGLDNQYLYLITKADFFIQ